MASSEVLNETTLNLTSTITDKTTSDDISKQLTTSEVIDKTNTQITPGVLDGTPNHSNAYVWLFMKGNFYLPGVFVSVFSVKRTNPNADLVVMVTGDVSDHSRKMLKKVATHLFEIPYISFESKQMKTDRQREIYGTWIASSYSKWNALALPYKKAILIDGDTIHTENTDELFELQAPAMPFASPFVKPLGTIQTHYNGPVGRDGYPAHGSIISVKILEDTLNIGGVLPTSTPALIEPNLNDFYEYYEAIKAKQPFGCPECHSGFDEQSITYYYATIKNKPYTSIHQRYNYYPWKDGFLFQGDVPRIIHFFSDTKPWTLKYDSYPDVICWYKMAALAIESNNIQPKDIALEESNINGAINAVDAYIKKFIRVVDVTKVLGKLKRE